MAVIKHPKQCRYHDGNDVCGLKRKYDAMFGIGSWEALERGVFERHPEFAPGGMFYRPDYEPAPIEKRKWWQFWKPKSNVTDLKEYKKALQKRLYD